MYHLIFMNKIKNKIFIIALVLILFLSSHIVYAKNQDMKTLDIENFSYKQEIQIAIDLSLEESKFQPIDIKINFQNPCWAKSENEHSVRVAYDKSGQLKEIDSQIYDLEFSEENKIKSCSIVFLIPDNLEGEEKFYVLYNSKQTGCPSYEDHLKIEDKHYFYEPISGQKIDFDYYEITEDEYVIYAIIQKGELLGNPVAQCIAKSIPGSKKVETNNIDQLGTFDIRYYIKKEPGYIGTSYGKNLEKEILIDGNLMVRTRIQTYSPNQNLKTDNIYTYYYCPTDKKSINVKTNHEVLKDIELSELEIYDGTFTGIVSIKSRSATISKMNVGDILPKLYVYCENDQIKDYNIPTNPASIENEAVLSTQADIDLGKKAWISLVNPDTGKTHGLILDKNTELIENHDDGAQVKAFVKQNIKLPGLEADTGNVFILRNSYENNNYNKKLKKGIIANYNVKFITLEKNGYESIDKESDIFQTLVKKVPIKDDGIKKDEEKKEKYSLTVYTHFAPTAPIGALLTAASGVNLSYTTVELYKENILESSGAAGRLPLGLIDLNMKDKKFFEKIKTIINFFDWGNSSLMKKIVFPNLEEGEYLIKVYKENPLLSKERQYIGYSLVNLTSNLKKHIFCKIQGQTSYIILDENDEPIENVKIILEKDDIILSEKKTDNNGYANINAPISITSPYNLRIFYQGFLVDEKQIKLGLKQHIFNEKNKIKIENHNLDLIISDTWGFTPSVETNPVITSDEMFEKKYIQPIKNNNQNYNFYDLYPANYLLNMKYKSFELNKDINVNKDISINLIFPAEFRLKINVLNIVGNNAKNCEVTLKRNEKTISKQINKNAYVTFDIPPGTYELSVKSKKNEIAKQEINIRGEKKINIVSSQDSQNHNIIFLLSISIIIISFIILFWKRKIKLFLKILIISLILLSVISPWWTVQGDSNNTNTQTNTYLYPPKIITRTTSNDISGGEIAQVPEEVELVLSLISYLLILTILIIIITILITNKFKKTEILLKITSLVIVILSLSVFYYAMTQLTAVSVGSFIGSGNLDVTIPGIAENKIINCSWGPGLGFYLALISIILIFITFFDKKINEKTKTFLCNRKH